MNKDSHLIWEAHKTHTDTTIENSKNLDRLVEQILIEEGLMDTIKGIGSSAAGAVKNIGKAVNDRMLQPVINKAIEWLKANDPDALVSIASAAEDGQQALDTAISQEGGDQVEKEIESSPETVNESVEEYKEILREHILYLHHEGLLSNISRGVGTAFRHAKKIPGAISKGVDDIKTGFQQGASGTPAAEPAQAEPAQVPEPAQAEPAQAEPAQAEPAPPETEQPGKIRKILNWVKANPNMSKGIAMGIMGAANVALGAAILPVIATAASGYAIGGGIKGVTKYRELRAQGVEPKEAIKQAAADAHSAGMTTGTIATGASLAGNLINKGTEMLKSPEPEADWRMDPNSGAQSKGIGDPSNGAADFDGDGMVSDQEVASWAEKQPGPGGAEIGQGPSGQVSDRIDGAQQAIDRMRAPVDINNIDVDSLSRLQQGQYKQAQSLLKNRNDVFVRKGEAILRRLAGGSNAQSFQVNEGSILNRPGWNNRTF